MSERETVENESNPESVRTGRAMSWSWVTLLVGLAGLLLFPSIASAGSRGYGNYNGYNGYNGNVFARPGFYVGGALVGGFTTRLEGELTEQPGIDNVEVDPSVGLAARAGFRTSEFFAVEAHYEWMDDFETSVAGVEIAETTTSALTADVKGYLATGQVQPYLSAGLGFLTVQSEDPATSFQITDTGFATRFGGGIEFYLTEHVGLSVDASYVVPTGDVKNFDYVSTGAGVFVRF